MSEIKVVGHHPDCLRKVVGCYSLDRAFVNERGEIGVPIGRGHEYFGLNHVGKSSFVYSLAGMLAEKGIALGDLEGFDPEYVTQVLTTVGFSGTLNIINEESDEDHLDAILKLVKEDEYSVGILDSIGAISPLAEKDGDIGEANWGNRGMAMANSPERLYVQSGILITPY